MTGEDQYGGVSCAQDGLEDVMAMETDDLWARTNGSSASTLTLVVTLEDSPSSFTLKMGTTTWYVPPPGIIACSAYMTGRP